jgi:hypothetical protein
LQITKKDSIKNERFETELKNAFLGFKSNRTAPKINGKKSINSKYMPRNKLQDPIS